MDNDLANTFETAKKKLGIIGLPKIIFDFIKAYKRKDPNKSDEEWLREQFEKPEYADAWKDGDKDPAAVAREIVQDVDNYETAKKDLNAYLEKGGTREKWIAKQIEIGAEKNGKDVEEYKEEISKALEDAAQENKGLFIDPINTTEDK